MIKRIFLAFVPLLFFTAIPMQVAGASLDLQSDTYLFSRESADSEQHLAFYEYLTADLEDFKPSGISFHAAGWGRADLGHESFGRRTNQELQYGYLQYAPGTANAAARLGRVIVTDGVAAGEQMDGLYLASDLVKGFGAAAYIGSPTETTAGKGDSGLLYGGRLSYGGYGPFQAGFSYLREEKDERFREEEGLDVRIRPMAKLEIDGRSSYNSIADRWMEHYYTVIAAPLKALRLTADAHWVDYRGFFQSPMNAAFGSPFIRPDEEMTAFGLVAEYAFPYGLLLAGDYRHYAYEIADEADVYGLSLTYSEEAYTLGIAVSRSAGDIDRLSYTELRGWAQKSFGKADVAVDVQNDSFDERVSGVKNAFSATGSLGYNLTDAARLAAALEYQENPFFEDDLRASLKFTYKFNRVFSPEGGPKP